MQRCVLLWCLLIWLTASLHIYAWVALRFMCALVCAICSTAHAGPVWSWSLLCCWLPPPKGSIIPTHACNILLSHTRTRTIASLLGVILTNGGHKFITQRQETYLKCKAPAVTFIDLRTCQQQRCTTPTPPLKATGSFIDAEHTNWVQPRPYAIIHVYINLHQR